MKRWLISAAVAASITALATPSVAAPPEESNPNAPGDVSFSEIVPAGVYCDFAVEVTLTGKGKAITLPNSRIITTSPGQKVTLSANGKTVSYVITGTSHIDVLGDPDDPTVVINEVRVTGQNLLTTPEPGLYFVKGNANYRIQTEPVFEEIRRFTVNAKDNLKVVDVCAALS